jgi:hypothetical protein
VRDQSHIDDMRAAVRGDLERLRARRQSVFERPSAPPPAAEEPAPQPEPVPTLVPQPAPLPEPELEPDPAPPPAAASAASEPRRFGRLAFWRR